MWYEIKAEAGSDTAEILIYDVIGDDFWNPDATSARKFVKDLKDITASNITLRINSPGGVVFDGNAIYNALRDHAATITVHIDGLAASIASIIALAGDKIIMAKNAMMMIHNPSTMAWGDSAEMRKTAEMLDKVRDSLIATYEDRSTSLTRDEIAEAMDAETWYSAQEAIDIGFADEIEGEAAVAALARFEPSALSKFQHVPGELVAALAHRPSNSNPQSSDSDSGEAAGGADTIQSNNPERTQRVRELLTARPI
jgi:ATP-dependent protease ClpP protease subunit